MTALQKSDGQTGHTPGPWQQHGSTPSIIVAEGVDIAQAFCPKGDGSLHECWANARLIAAAPELLAELILAREEVADTRRCIFESCTIRNDPLTLDEDAKPDIIRLDAQLARIDAAIIKATAA